MKDQDDPTTNRQAEPDRGPESLPPWPLRSGEGMASIVSHLRDQEARRKPPEGENERQPRR
jgi:hypothetical protein